MREVRGGFLLLLCGLLLTPARAAAPAAPADVVNGFHAALIDNMRHGKTQACEARIDKLAPVVRNTFAVPTLAKLVLRRHWSGLSDEQKENFTAELEDLIVTTYASQFNSWSGEQFTAGGTDDGPGVRRTVHTTLAHPPDEPHSFDYVLESSPAGWRVINVLADGMSDLAVRTAQYDAVIKNQGFDALLSGLQKQIEQNRHAC